MQYLRGSVGLAFPKLVAPLVTLVVLVLAVACGAAATATPAPQATTAPAPVSGATTTPAPKPAATATPAGPVVNPGKLTIMVSDWAGERFDPIFGARRPGGLHYGRIVHAYLLSDNEKRDMLPGIASQWSLSADGKTWTYIIRKGVKFHNGAELTPEDVSWSLNHMFAPASTEYFGLVATPEARLVEKIEQVGADQVVIKTTTPITTFDSTLSEASDKWYPIMPKRAKLFDADLELAYDKSPIAAGPMKLVKHTPAALMAFERFDDFYYQPKNGFKEDKRYQFRSLDLLLVPEEATRVAAVRSGEADIVPASLTTRKQVEAGGGRLIFGQEGVYVDAKFMGCWETKYPCSKKEVRQALDYALDKNQIRDKLYGGTDVFQTKGWMVFTPSTVGYTTALDPWPFDPNKARQLLADAGYPKGQGFGKLIVNTFPSSSMPLQVEAAEFAADSWRRELGLDVEVKVGDSLAIAKSWRAGELNGQFLWRDNEARRDATAIMRSSHGDLKSLTRISEDPVLLKLVEQTTETVDAAQRARTTQDTALKLREATYQLGIGYVNIPWGVGPRVVAWQPYPLAPFPAALHTVVLK
ncbi:MAG: ABC transporter substrate-binding protein [SAR202 cluster bacterium]|nr:ABC transporter substrate-binding protein [SAR202 cluster bacterium]